MLWLESISLKKTLFDEGVHVFHDTIKDPWTLHLAAYLQAWIVNRLDLESSLREKGGVCS